MDGRITGPDDPRAPNTEATLAQLDAAECEGWAIVKINTIQLRHLLNYIDKQQQHILNITGEQQ